MHEACFLWRKHLWVQYQNCVPKKVVSHVRNGKRWALPETNNSSIWMWCRRGFYDYDGENFWKAQQYLKSTNDYSKKWLPFVPLFRCDRKRNWRFLSLVANTLMDGVVLRQWFEEPLALAVRSYGKWRQLQVDNCSSQIPDDALQKQLYTLVTTLNKFLPNTSGLIQPPEYFATKRSRKWGEGGGRFTNLRAHRMSCFEAPAVWVV